MGWTLSILQERHSEEFVWEMKEMTEVRTEDRAVVGVVALGPGNEVD